MRSLLLSSLLVPALALAAEAPHKPVIALLPTQSATPELTHLALLIEARAGELLEASDKYSELHSRQVLAMARQEGLDAAKLSEAATADLARELIGADRVVAVTLAATADGKGLVLQGSVRGEQAPATFEAKLPTAWPAALAQGSEALAKAVLAQDKGTLAANAKAQPESKSEEALKQLGTCWETALTQSMSIEAPVSLGGKELETAIAACQASLKADPTLKFTSATLALLQAIAREDDDAEKTLRAIPDPEGMEPFALARFWLTTRYKSNEAGVLFLASYLKKHPSELLLQAYLGETLGSMNFHARALNAWNDYLTLQPRSAFAYGRLSRSYARLNQMEEAFTAAQKGLELAPKSREARLQLANRQIDAKKLDDAIATLKPMADGKDAPAEYLLRLGWAYWLKGDVASAAPLFVTSSERATGSHGWKTKGRAFYNLALVAAKQGQADAAKAAYKQSQETGLVVRPLDPTLAAIVAPELLVAVKDAGVNFAALPLPEGTMMPGGLYVVVDPVETKVPGLAEGLGHYAEVLAREKLVALGASFAPAGEDTKGALAVIKKNKLKGYRLKVTLLPGSSPKGMKADVLVLTYPENGIKGSWSAAAASGRPDAIIKTLVPLIVDDAATDLDWKG